MIGRSFQLILSLFLFMKSINTIQVAESIIDDEVATFGQYFKHAKEFWYDTYLDYTGDDHLFVNTTFSKN